ncbi:MAG TPA: helix-turn-helix domain-containing protein, partial [Thermoanaerobaculia bacterium]|nr:helix-turn-helix domain-containing protein [Thermoanaerobaculia bacterium]
THLIGIVYHRVKKEPRLGKYLPVWLAESEAYSVYSAAILLLQVAQQLVVELQQSGDPGAGPLRARIAELAQGGDDPTLFEELVQLLRDEARSRGRILLVLMENLDAALAGLPGRRGTGQVQRLRAMLSEDKELLFLSTTPTRYLAALLDPRQPLYGQLKERTLQPLTEEEVGQLLTRLAEITGQPAKAGFEGPEPEFRVRRRVLHRLTGGNPRAVVMGFSVLTGSPGVQAIVEEMSALLDAQTAYFEARLAQLAPRERAVVAAMALDRDNLTLKEISKRSRLPLRALSTQVKRLQEQGYVLPVAGEGGKGTLYELGDGLFRLWYQYRKGMRILAPIVNFLAYWHPLEVLERSLTELRSAEEEGPLLERDLIRLVVVQIKAAVELARSEGGKSLREQLWSECAATLAMETFVDRVMKATPEEFDSLKSETKQVDANTRKARAFPLGLKAFELGQFVEAETYLREVADLNLKAEPPLILAKAIANAQLKLGEALEAQNREVEALAVYRHYYPRLGDERGLTTIRTYFLVKIFQLLPVVFSESPEQFLRETERFSIEFLLHDKQAFGAYEGSREEILQLVLLMKSLALLGRGAEVEAKRSFAEWAERVAASNASGEVFRDALSFITTWLSHTALKTVFARLLDSDDRAVAEEAKLFSLVSNVAAAEIDGHPDQARRALARVPSELRQTVSDLAKEAIAARRQAKGIAEVVETKKGV